MNEVVAGNELEAELLNNLEAIIAKLDALIYNTEHYYEIVHESLPVIERNIDLTDQETKLIIRYFIEADERKNGSQDDESVLLVAQALQQIKTNFKEISRFLLDQNQINNLLKLFLNDNQSEDQVSFENFITLIKEIEKTMVDVSEISLNAIIFSSRSGDEGRGFGVISDVILQTSSQLEKEFSNVSQVLDQLEDWHDNFATNVQLIVGNQEKALNTYIGCLDKLFAEVVDSMQIINDILRNLMDNVMQVVAPFQELMALIQRQDIVRQNIENVVKCLRIVQGKYQELHRLPRNEENKSECLDLVVFMQRATELVDRLSNNMTIDLNQSIDGILTTTDNMLQALHEVMEDGEQLTKLFYNEPEKTADHQDQVETCSVNLTFNEVFDFMNQFTKLLVDTSQLVDGLGSDKHVFYENFNVVKKNMAGITSKVEVLNRVKILGKIELARMVTPQASAFGEKIEEVIDHVSSTVSQNNNMFSALKSNLEQDLDNFEKIIVGNQKYIDEAIGEVSDSIERLGATNNIINEAIYALYKEIANLYNEVDHVYKRLAHNQDIKIGCTEVLELMGEISMSVDILKGETFEHYQVEQWEEKDEELLELFSLFTSYLEKYTAKEYLGEDDFDAGSEEGELTLF